MATQNQAILQQAISEATQNRTTYLQLCKDVIGQARTAGVTEQQLLDQIHNWFESGGMNTPSKK